MRSSIDWITLAPCLWCQFRPQHGSPFLIETLQRQAVEELYFEETSKSFLHFSTYKESDFLQYLGSLKCEHIVVKNDELSVEQIDDLKPRGILISPGPGIPHL